MAALIFLLTAALSALRFRIVLRTDALGAIFHLLFAYFSLLYVNESMSGFVFNVESYTNRALIVERSTILGFALCWLLSYISYSAIEMWAERMLIGRHQSSFANQSELAENSTAMIPFVMLYALGVVGMLGASLGGDYRLYVEGQISGWAFGFFVAGSAYINMLAMRGRYLFAVIAALPYIFLSLYIGVRFFLLLGVIAPLVGVVLRHSTGGLQLTKSQEIKLALLVMSVFGIQSLLLYMRADVYMMPEQLLVKGSLRIAGYAAQGGIGVSEFDSLTRFLLGIFTPFFNFFGVNNMFGSDSPIIFARILQGTSTGQGGFLHFPLIYVTESYATLGILGFVFSAVWSLIFALLRQLLCTSLFRVQVFLPVYLWVFYMWFRGAGAVAVSSISYGICALLIVFGFVSYYFRHQIGDARRN